MTAMGFYMSTISESAFLNYPATIKLQNFAKNPIDLTKELNPDRMTQFVAKACSFKLLYGTERVTQDVLLTLQQLAEESKALDKMKRMQDGEVMNFIEGYSSENRPALHTATRDLFDHPRTAKKAQEAAQLAKKEIEKLRLFLDKNDREGQFTDLVTVAIGGSDLGPRAHYYALEHLLKSNRRIHFISNVDPDDVAGVLKKIPSLDKTLVAVVSKSGTTLETATNEELVREKFRQAGLDPKKHFVSITMPGSPMDNQREYLETFYMWDWIGGRYSTTSMCGALMLSFAFGIETFWEFLKGAHAMDQVALEQDLNKNLPLLAALLGIWNRNFLNYPTVALIPYSQALVRYTAHIQQVDMESNGKHVDQHGSTTHFQTGPIIWGEPGTNSQHSFFQLIHQGTAIIPVSIVAFKKSVYGEDLLFQGTTSQEKLLSNLFAQSLALSTGQISDNPNQSFSGNRPTNILLAEQLTPYTLGALLSFFENKVAFQGFVWGINSFDQEGVQLGKVLANRFIDQFAQRRKGTKKTDFALGEAYLQHLDRMD
jgi:glucose-6-phosphate isomerase